MTRTSITRTGAALLAAAMLVYGCGGATATPTPAPTPVATATPAPAATPTAALVATPTPAPTTVGGFPALPALPNGWAWYSDPAKTYRIGLPTFFVSIPPADAFAGDPSFAAKAGAVGDYQDSRMTDRVYCTPGVVVESLPYAKSVVVNSSADLMSWALKDIAVNGLAGGTVQNSTNLGVHQGYAVAIIEVLPGSDVTGAAVQRTLDVYYASATGIWDVNVLACGDDAWNNLTPTLSVLPSYFEAPPGA